MNHEKNKTLQAIWTAYHHYEAESKMGKEYAKPIAQGLQIALKKVEKYDELISFLSLEE